ncbi:MAG: NADPH:quinone reductase [Gammaproteobacteria bacterium]|jgi:NADPH2:quinone reductase|nr:NADPH:quinone reductase [Gammaproteobacteria bacterium]MDH3864506.1 NADPH:quinone reductase [Gammaproteobacteria bacterium]MDH3907424.1 NADPH:quinone reductase [Gammaproteobacteria bacterium]
MRAARFHKFGPAREVLELCDIDTPEPGPGEVLVRLHTSAINPSDVKKRAGAFPDLLDGGFVIPNSDGAGVIELVGEGVDKSRKGERVWVFQAQHERRFGTAAEYVAISSNCAPRLPEKAGFDAGTCLGIPAMTAHRAVFADGEIEDKTLLIMGGAGRVGYYAIQWARRAGATVIATASNAVDKATCLDAGADHVVDHRANDFARQVLEASKGALIDRVVDLEFGTNLPVSVEVLRVGGTIAAYGSARNPEPVLPFYKMMYKDLTVRMIIVYSMPVSAKDHAVADINSALSNGWLQHRIARALPLEDIAVGNEIVEAGETRGAVVLNID